MAEAAACDPGMKQLTTGTNQELWNFISQLSRKSAAPRQSKTQSGDLWVYSKLLECFSVTHTSFIVTPHKVPRSGRTIIELNWEYPEPHAAGNIQAREVLFLKLTLTWCFYLSTLKGWMDKAFGVVLLPTRKGRGQKGSSRSQWSTFSFWTCQG